jgi:hypothetical protein
MEDSIMSTVGGTEPCRLCGAPSFYYFDCRSNESQHTCETCGFEAVSEERKTADGKRVWVETGVYPVEDNSAKVRRPEFSPFWNGYSRWDWGTIKEWVFSHLGRRISMAYDMSQRAKMLEYEEKYGEKYSKTPPTSLAGPPMLCIPNTGLLNEVTVVEEQVAADPRDFEENYAESSGLYDPAPVGGTVIIGGQIVSTKGEPNA